MRILAGAVARQHPDVLRAHLTSMRWQRGGHHVDLFYVDDGGVDGDGARAVLAGFDVRTEEATCRPDAAQYAVGEDTHHWNVPTFHHLARNKQRILDLAVAEGYDAVWLVDSDLLCAPDTLQTLVDADKEIISAVFWTRWNPADAPLPQVWQVHPYGFDGAGWTGESFLSALESRELVRVRGLGACTLIRRDALLRGAGYWPLVEGLPSHGMWQGEDRHFCVRAERLHIPMWADAWPEIFHVYRPADRALISDWLGTHDVLAEGTPLPGDWVRFTVEPCEESQLVLHREHVRGRLGMLDVVPDVERALLEMRVGDSRFVHARFPASWPIESYRGQARTLRVRLLGIRAPD